MATSSGGVKIDKEAFLELIKCKEYGEAHHEHSQKFYERFAEMLHLVEAKVARIENENNKLKKENEEMKVRLARVEEEQNRMKNQPTQRPLVHIPVESTAPRTKPIVQPTSVNQVSTINQLRITGLPEAENNQSTDDQVLDLFKTQLNMVKQKGEIKAERMGILRTNQSSPRNIVVSFQNIWIKKSVYKERANLKDYSISNKVFLSEILTPENNKLFYEARMARKQGLIYTTYTQDGAVFVKKLQGMKSQEISTYTELQNIANGEQNEAESTMNTAINNTSSDNLGEQRRMLSVNDSDNSVSFHS